MVFNLESLGSRPNVKIAMLGTSKVHGSSHHNGVSGTSTCTPPWQNPATPSPGIILPLLSLIRDIDVREDELLRHAFERLYLMGLSNGFLLSFGKWLVKGGH